MSAPPAQVTANHVLNKDGMMTKALAVGDIAPDFTLPADGGGSISLKSLKGRKVVLYFYPKDDTPGCTLEAKGFNDHKAAFAAAGAEIIGVSPDSVASHDKFKRKYGLSFALASDEGKAMLEAYGVWAEKSMYGKKYMGVERSTFLIGADGKVLHAWTKVKVPGHVEEVLAAAKAG
jgi:thioredoxin-dependent peroxiredoxin